MQFQQARQHSLLWIGLATFNVVLSVERYRRHHSHDAFALVQAITWLLVIGIWTLILTTSWTFTQTSLLQRRAFRLRDVSYDSITSVEPPPGTSVEPPPGRPREAAVIVYGGNLPLTRIQRLTVQPQDFAGFLAELERRAPQAVFRV